MDVKQIEDLIKPSISREDLIEAVNGINIEEVKDSQQIVRNIEEINEKLLDLNLNEYKSNISKIKEAILDKMEFYNEEFWNICTRLYEIKDLSNSPEECEKRGLDYNKIVEEIIELKTKASKYEKINLNDLELEYTPGENIMWVLTMKAEKELKENSTDNIETLYELRIKYADASDNLRENEKIITELENERSYLREKLKNPSLRINKEEVALNNLGNASTNEIDEDLKNNESEIKSSSFDGNVKTNENIISNNEVIVPILNTSEENNKTLPIIKWTKVSKIANSKKGQISNIINVFENNKINGITLITDPRKKVTNDKNLNNGTISLSDFKNDYLNSLNNQNLESNSTLKVA